VSAVLGGVLLLLALPPVAATSYLLLLTVLSGGARRRKQAAQVPTTRFDLVVPAHDEALGVAHTVRSLATVDYPEHLRRIIVVADNCSDDTAQRAETAGATVLVRTDATRRGKGFALAYAFEWSARQGNADALVVIDADSVASPNLLLALDASLRAGEVAVQVRYGVRNPSVSWRTRLMAIALAAFHDVRSLGRERLGTSCGLRGNGMCLRSSLLSEVPWDAFSIVEDVEYGLRLGRAGHRVAYVDEACVLGDMVAGEEGSRSQRQRWEGGRAALRRAQLWPLLRDAVRGRNGLLLDLAMDLLVPPLSMLAVAVVLGGLASVAQWGLHGGAGAVVASALFGFGAASLVAYVLAGWWRSGTGLRGLVDLVCAPVFVVWKLTLSRPPSSAPAATQWVRTSRDGRP
jgi:hypothetical protein